MKYDFVIKKRYDGGAEEIINAGLCEDYISVFANTVSDLLETTTPDQIVTHMTDYGRGYFAYRVWDYSYIMEIIINQ